MLCFVRSILQNYLVLPAALTKNIPSRKASHIQWQDGLWPPCWPLAGIICRPLFFDLPRFHTHRWTTNRLFPFFYTEILKCIKYLSFSFCLGPLQLKLNLGESGQFHGVGKRGRPRRHAIKVPLPPIYVFIRNLLHNEYYNPRVVSWVNESFGVFRVNNTNEFAKTWGLMKSNRGVKMNYEKLSRAMRYHYGNAKQGRKGHLAMVKEKRLFYRFGELAVNWKSEDVKNRPCLKHDLCKDSFCLWSKE